MTLSFNEDDKDGFIWMQKLYTENRMEKLELLKGLTLGREDTPNISPLQQVPFSFFSTLPTFIYFSTKFSYGF